MGFDLKMAWLVRFASAAACTAAFVAVLVLPGPGAMSGGQDVSRGSGELRRKSLVVFVIDASWSMRIRDAGDPLEPITRLEYATRELLDTIAGLKEHGDLVFDVVAFSSRVDTLSGSLGLDQPMALNAQSEQAAARFLYQERAGGMTRLPRALEEAFELCERAPLSLRPGSVLVFTDGIPTYGRARSGPHTNEDFLRDVKAALPAGVKVSAFAVSPTLEGAGFLQALCKETNGILFTP